MHPLPRYLDENRKLISPLNFGLAMDHPIIKIVFLNQKTDYNEKTWNCVITCTDCQHDKLQTRTEGEKNFSRGISEQDESWLAGPDGRSGLGSSY